MDEIRKFSKEWFVAKGKPEQMNAAKNMHRAYSNEYMRYGEINPETFIGNKEEARAKYQELKNNSDGYIFSEESVIEYFGGVDNLFELIDSDRDGNITPEEFKAIAAADTDEFADVDDETFSAMDLRKVYENAIAAENGTFEENERTIIFKYRDGSVTKINKADDGHILSKTTEKKIKNKETEVTELNYDTKVKTDSIKDKNGRVRFASIDAKGKVNDKKITTKYNDSKNSKIVTTETSGRIIKENYNGEGRLVSKTQTLKYNSNSRIEDTEQQSIGDCWLLSGINALRTTQAGRKIISDALVHHSDGSVTVKLKGVDREYTYTPEQIGAHEYYTPEKDYSIGDIDMNILEMAIAEYRKEIMPEDPLLRTGKLGSATPEDPLNSGWQEETIEYLTGLQYSQSFNVSDINEYLISKQNKSENYAMLTQFKEDDPSFGDDVIIQKHAYSISRVTDNDVFVVNPHDSSKEIRYPKDMFLENVLYTTRFKIKEEE